MSALETEVSSVEERPTVSLPTVEALMDEGTFTEPGDEADGAAAPEAAPMGEQFHRLPGIALPANVLLQSAAMRLVEQKDQIDALAQQGLLAPLLPAQWMGSHGGVDLRAFVASVVPFIPAAGRGEVAAARVPLKFLLGESRRWGVEDVTEPRSLAAYLASDERATPGAKDGAEVMMIAPLGLCWAHEGRTRVSFLRRMGGTSVAARVTALEYPAPAQLMVFQGTGDYATTALCVLDGRKVRPLVAPWLTVPLLAAYGVGALQEWPANWPTLERVNAELLRTPEVDLAKLVEKVRREQADESWSDASLMQLNTWLPRWKFFLTTFIAMPVGMLLLGALALPRAVEVSAVAGALGFAAGAIAALAVPWIHARRKHLN